MKETGTGLSPLGKAGEEIARLAAIAGGIGVIILIPGLFGLWMFDEGPIVLVVIRIGAFISLVGLTTIAGSTLAVMGAGVPESLEFRSHPVLLRVGIFIISAAIAWWEGAFGILVAISTAAVFYREWMWKRRASNEKT